MSGGPSYRQTDIPEKLVKVLGDGLDDLDEGLHRVLAVKTFKQRV